MMVVMIALHIACCPIDYNEGEVLEVDGAFCVIQASKQANQSSRLHTVTTIGVSQSILEGWSN